MAYSILVEDTDEYLLLKVSGMARFESEHSLDVETAQIVELHGIDRTLIDLRQVEGELSAADIYALASRIYKPGLARKEALVDAPEHLQANGFLNWSRVTAVSIVAAS